MAEKIEYRFLSVDAIVSDEKSRDASKGAMSRLEILDAYTTQKAALGHRIVSIGYTEMGNPSTIVFEIPVKIPGRVF